MILVTERKSNEHQGGGADTLKFNLHIIGRAKKGCEFKIFQKKIPNHLFIIQSL
jgi:hypothetical protein